MACRDCPPDQTRVAGWRAWYDGGRVFDSRTSEWADLPDDGLLFVVVYFAAYPNDTTRRPYAQVYHGADRYWHVPTDLFASGNEPEDDIRARYPRASVKRGRWVSAAEWSRVHDEAMTSGWGRGD